MEYIATAGACVYVISEALHVAGNVSLCKSVLSVCTVDAFSQLWELMPSVRVSSRSGILVTI